MTHKLLDPLKTDVFVTPDVLFIWFISTYICIH